MSIRWKLFLTLFLLTAGATALVLVVAEREFRDWVREEVEARFEAQVRGLFESREDRLATFRNMCSELAEHPVLKAELSGEPAVERRGELIRKFMELRGGQGAGAGRPKLPDRPEAAEGGLRPGSRQRNTSPNRPAGLDGKAGGGLGKNLPVIGVIESGGEIRHFGRAVVERTKLRQKMVAERIAKISRKGTQQIAYVVLHGEGKQQTRVQEVVLTPVRNDAGSLLGWFFVGFDAETRVERNFQQSEQTSGRDGRTGLVVDGEWFVRGVSDEQARSFAAAASETLWAGSGSEVVTVDEQEFLLIAKDLNPDSPLGKGYQMVVFPLDGLVTAVARLRLAVCALGSCAVLAAAVCAFFLAGRFSRPIAALVEGTKRVRDGSLEGEVTVYAKDEFGALAGAFNAMTQDLALKERYREVLGMVSDPAVAQRLVEGDLELGGEVREAAVLFCDIRGFTAMTEGMDPHEVIGIINEHMTAMTKLVYLHGGVVDKFVGDLVMAIFGVPTSGGDDAARAARCALEMIAERRKLDETSGRSVEIGIGVAFGELVAGCMGSTDRLNYTVLGDRVNLASRLCGAAGRGEVLVDGAMAAALDDEIIAEEREPIELKGFSELVEVFALRS